MVMRPTHPTTGLAAAVTTMLALGCVVKDRKCEEEATREGLDASVLTIVD
jgi:hypothetical protein